MSSIPADIAYTATVGRHKLVEEIAGIAAYDEKKASVPGTRGVI
nr:hypothetical protein [Candidatus Sigynarchaeota archaeon]